VQRTLATTGGLIWRSLSIPIKVAGQSRPVGLAVNLVYLAVGFSFATGDKVFRFYIPVPGPLMPLELTFPQTLVIVAALATFIGSLIWNYTVDINRLQDALAPKLTIPRGLGAVSVETDPQLPGTRIAVLTIKNMSGTAEVSNTIVQVVDCEPTGKFRINAPMQWLERSPPPGSTGGITINAGGVAQAQIARTMFESGRLVARPTHAIYGGIEERLSPGRYRVALCATGSKTRKLTQRVLLTVNENLQDPFTVELDGPLLIE
jgi:hypothetical protein